MSIDTLSNNNYDLVHNNKRPLFDQIEIFIDRCCPSTITLKQVAPIHTKSSDSS